MKSWKQLLGLFFVLIIYGQIAARDSQAGIEADDSAIRQMAQIMLNLNHYPDAAGKETLKSIMEDETVSDHVHTLATAMMNLNHYASSADKERLQKIIDDQSASMDARSLAGIIKNIAHKPSSADKKELQEMID